jgi:hypothetical protein
VSYRHEYDRDCGGLPNSASLPLSAFREREAVDSEFISLELMEQEPGGILVGYGKIQIRATLHVDYGRIANL